MLSFAISIILSQLSISRNVEKLTFPGNITCNQINNIYVFLVLISPNFDPFTF